MNFDDAVAAFASATALPREAMEWVLDHWSDTGPLCANSVESYVSGRDQSERTERALFVVFHLLAEKSDTAAYLPLCLLLKDRERADLIFGDDGVTQSAAAILISTFDGDPAPLYALAEHSGAEDVARGECLMVLAYLALTRRISESDLYRFLAAFASRPGEADREHLWFSWAMAVGGMGFAGLSGAVEAMFQDGRISPDLMSPAHFWDDLREAREDPGKLTGGVWDGIGPVTSAIEWLQRWNDSEEAYGSRPNPIAAPVRNPLREVGRNDPCPCGSGKKYKQCCLAAA